MVKGMITREAGAVLNKNNKSALRNAFKTIGKILASAGIDLTKDDEEDGDGDGEQSTTKEAAGFSVADTATLLQTALDATREPLEDPERYRAPLRILDIFEDQGYFTYTDSWSGTPCYRVNFAVAEDGSVTLDTPSIVVRKVTYVVPGASADTSEAAREAGGVFDWLIDSEPIEVIESAIATDGSAKIKLIDANRWGSTGFYSADMLRRDGPIAFPAGTKMYIDHDTPAEEATRPEGSIERLAATFETAANFEDDPKHGSGLYARIRVRDALRVDLDNISQWIGTSIRAPGKARIGEAQGIKGPIITQLLPSPLNRVDFVTVPGAGGKVLPLFESMRRRVSLADNDKIADNNSNHSKGDQEMTNEELQAAIAAGIREAITPLQTEVARLREAAVLQDAEKVVRQHVSGIAGLPRVMVDRVVPMIVREATVDQATGKLDAAALIKRADEIVRGEASYYSALGGARIVGLGESNAGDQPAAETEADFETEVAETFARWGLSESAAKVAARGRARA